MEQTGRPALFIVQKQDTPARRSRWLGGIGRRGIPNLPGNDTIAGRHSFLPLLLVREGEAANGAIASSVWYYNCGQGIRC
jgi:hypothetical protein